MALLTALLAASLAPAMAQDAGGAERIEKTLPAGTPALELLAGFGPIVVRRDAQATQTRLVAEPTRWDERCELRFTGDAERAIASVVSTDGRSLRRCKTSIELILAGDISVQIEAQRGAVRLEGTWNSVAVDLQRGRIELVDVSGPVDLFVGVGGVRGRAASPETSVDVRAGRVALSDLIAPVEVEVGLGRVGLRYSAVPAGRVSARAGVGRVSVDFPYGSWLATTLDPGVGRVKSEIPFSDDAYTQLEASTRVGNIEIGTVLQPPSAELATR